MSAATIDWDSVELLPRKQCCVCAKSKVPWGRTLDNDYFCSKQCCESHAIRSVRESPKEATAPAILPPRLSFSMGVAQPFPLAA